MIKALSTTQSARFLEFVARGLKVGLATGPVDRSQAKAYASKLNKFLKRPQGPTIVMHGPRYAWLAARLLGGAQVWDQVWAQVSAQVLAQVSAQVLAQVSAQVRDQVRDQVSWDDFTWPWFDGQFFSYWVIWADFFSEVLGINLPDYSIISDQLSFGLVYPLSNGAVVFSDRPLSIHKNPEGLHRDGGPALEYGDGTKLWHLNGVQMPEAVVMANDKDFDKDWFLKNENVEQRREVLRKFGVERVLSDLKATVIEKKDDYELLMIELGNGVEACPALKMKNPSEGTWHVEWVDRACRTVESALEFRNQSKLKPSKLT